MSTNTYQVGPWQIIREQEDIPVYSNRPSRDEKWRFIDAAGHGHFWQDGYPTLKVVEVECGCSAVDEPHTVSHYECPHCGEQIEPGTIPPSGFPTYIKGPVSVDLIYDDGRERRKYVVRSPEDAAALMADPVSAIPRLTEGVEPVEREWRSGLP